MSVLDVHMKAKGLLTKKDWHGWCQSMTARLEEDEEEEDLEESEEETEEDTDTRTSLDREIDDLLGEDGIEFWTN